AYNPLGGNDLMATATPTVLDTPMDLARNKAWHGGLIKPDWMEGLPAHQQKFKDTDSTLTGRVASGITKTLADSTGRVIDISPNDLIYAYEQYIGGAGRFGKKIVDTGTQMASGKGVNINNVPFV